MMDSLLQSRFFTQKKITWFLIFYSMLVFWLTKDIVGNDSTTYIGYFEGWKLGRYTYWYDIKDYIPDTFRNPGFPFVIAILCTISKKIIFLQLAQFIIYCITLVLLIRIITKNYPNTSVPLLFFGGITFLNPVLPLYNSLIVPEVLTGFLIVLILYTRMFSVENYKKYVLTGILFAVLFQVRPIVLFLPFILFVSDWLVQRKNFAFIKNATVLLIYVVSMLPYGYWNYKTHGIFTVTSIEGGGGVLHLGYWSLKMPGFTERRYWNNGTERGLISFTPESEVKQNIEAFNREWDYIDSSCAKYLTDKDRRNIEYMVADGARFVTYNGRYTYEREKLLKQLAFKHYTEDWRYTLKIKIYTFFRLWVTGLSKNDLQHASGFEKIKMWIPVITTGFTFLLALLFIPLALIKRKLNFTYWLPVLLTIAYWGGIHMPFAIQARYTIPVRLLLILLTAISVYELYFRKKEEN